MFGCDIDCGRRDMLLAGLLRLGITTFFDTSTNKGNFPPFAEYTDKLSPESESLTGRTILTVTTGDSTGLRSPEGGW